MKAFKYQGAGNDFIIFDNRLGEITLNDSQIRTLCDRRYGIGADGLMLLGHSHLSDRDFKMDFYNSDGFPGTMCGNGARCIVAFAARLGFKKFDFEAPDGFHTGSVISYSDKESIIRVQIRNVDNYRKYSPNSYYVNTGVDHLVVFVDDVANYDVDTNGRYWRHHKDFPNGTNVNFVETTKESLKIRTFERGVEAETYACGTGATASAIASYLDGKHCCEITSDQTIKYTIHTLKNTLSVEFKPDFSDVYLTGPATYVFETEI